MWNPGSSGRDGRRKRPRADDTRAGFPTVNEEPMTEFESDQIEGIARNRNAVRPVYIELDDDTDGASHVYRITDETIHVVQNSQPVQKFVLNGRSVNDYVKFVRDEVEGREWANRRYVADDEDPFAALVEQLADSTEVAA